MNVLAARPGTGVLVDLSTCVAMTGRCSTVIILQFVLPQND